MPVFISYSHEDIDFAERLAEQLVVHKARVWIDKWQLNVGDSILQRIQEAITGASALLVVLSPASVASEWCKKELTAGLVRELEEKRVVVLPLLIKDCEIPLFLRDKLYADFRKSFDTGLEGVLTAVAKVTSESAGRLDAPEFYIDWAVDYGLERDAGRMDIILIEQAKGEHYTCLTEIRILFNEPATRRYMMFHDSGLEWIESTAVIAMLAIGAYDKDLRVVLEDHKPKRVKITMQDKKRVASYEVVVTSRRVGTDNGRDTLLDLGGQLRQLLLAQRQVHRAPTAEEVATIKRIQRDFER